MFLDYNLDIASDSVWLLSNKSPKANDYPFIMNEIGYYIAKENYFTTRVDQHDMLLLYTVSGEGVVNYEKDTYLMTAGSAMLIDCSIYHSYQTRPNSKEDWVFFWTHFDSIYKENYYRLLSHENSLVLNVGESYEIENAFQLAIASFEGEFESRNGVLSGVVSTMLTYLVAHKYDKSNTNRIHQQLVNKVVKYIKNHFTEKINLDGMAQSANVSKYYLINLFKRQMKITPYQYLLQVRVSEAQKLLRTTDYKAVTISQMVGFEDESNFSRTFKRLAGETPLRYREKFVQVDSDR